MNQLQDINCILWIEDPSAHKHESTYSENTRNLFDGTDLEHT